MSAGNRDATRDQFERRMRQRRAATCVRVARQALADGRIVDAEERLDEACRLDPDDTEAQLLLEELRADRAAEIGDGRLGTDARGGDGWSHWFAAAVAILALAALAFFWPPPNDTARRERPARQTPSAPVVDLPVVVQLQPTSEAPLEVTAPAPSPDRQVDTSGTSGDVAARMTVGTTTSAAETPGKGRRAGEPSAAPLAPAAEARSNPPAPNPVNPLEATGSTPPAPIERPVDFAAAPRPAETAPRLDTIAAPPAVSSHDPASTPLSDPALASLRPEAAPTISDEELIRGTLTRYADAYARLDVRAAQQVWPTVDAAALRRAFDGLASQGLVFERCELRVTGGDATAACRGRAEYVPKVGSREPLSVSRLWVFTLKKAESGWAIRSADAR